MYVKDYVKELEEFGESKEAKELIKVPTLSYLCSFYWGPKFEELREMTEEENK